MRNPEEGDVEHGVEAIDPAGARSRPSTNRNLGAHLWPRATVSRCWMIFGTGEGESKDDGDKHAKGRDHAPACMAGLVSHGNLSSADV